MVFSTIYTKSILNWLGFLSLVIMINVRFADEAIVGAEAKIPRTVLFKKNSTPVKYLAQR